MHSDSETTRLASEARLGEPFVDPDTGLTCFVYDCNGHYNGYVQVPDGHIFYQKQYSQCVKPDCTERDRYEFEMRGRTRIVDHCGHTAERILDCHGGVTFTGPLITVDDRLSGWWLGFDTNHYGGAFTVSQDLDYVVSETLKLAKQLV